jgi:hypothetical protein
MASMGYIHGPYIDSLFSLFSSSGINGHVFYNCPENFSSISSCTQIAAITNAGSSFSGITNINGFTNNGETILYAPAGTYPLAVQNPTRTANYFTVDTSGNVQANGPFTALGPVSWGFGPAIANSSLVPLVGTPTAGQAACIKAAGPPVIIGYCSTAVSSAGSCTCN